MEKTNELNKFLSYIHMGNSIYRIYYKEAVSLKNVSTKRFKFWKGKGKNEENINQNKENIDQ